ncbi:MAG: ribosome small subunit-dependent GTPase A [Elusimicrobiota bacterium]|nr:ribosome small subunit-dependent GTPase A [Elusimicrobiota bacterium]
MATLVDWGWDARWAEAFGDEAGRAPARVIEEQRGAYRVVCGDGEHAARITGAQRHKSEARADLPAVGDWVAAERLPQDGTLVIRRVLPRRSKLSRKAAGETTEEQLIAANLDSVFVMTSLDADFNARRLERFLTVCRESGAEPVVVLNKLDACADPLPFLGEARLVALSAPVVTISAKTGHGVEGLAAWIRPGRTVGCVGTSGVGKSTLINRRLGAEKFKTAETRASDARGRHTTTHRQLVLLPGGGVLLDTPGMREMQLWESDKGLAAAFDEIASLAPACRFRDCGHDAEPGCAVKAAVESGALDPARLESFHKLKREAAFQARRVDEAAAAAKKKKDKAQSNSLKQHPRYKR